MVNTNSTPSPSTEPASAGNAIWILPLVVLLIAAVTLGYLYYSTSTQLTISQANANDYQSQLNTAQASLGQFQQYNGLNGLWQATNIWLRSTDTTGASSITSNTHESGVDPLLMYAFSYAGTSSSPGALFNVSELQPGSGLSSAVGQVSQSITPSSVPSSAPTTSQFSGNFIQDSNYKATVTVTSAAAGTYNVAFAAPSSITLQLAKQTGVGQSYTVTYVWDGKNTLTYTFTATVTSSTTTGNLTEDFVYTVTYTKVTASTTNVIVAATSPPTFSSTTPSSSSTAPSSSSTAPAPAS